MNGKAKVIKGIYEGKTVTIEGTDKEVMGKSVWLMNGNPAAMAYGARSGMAGLPIDGKHYYGKLDGLGHFFHEIELEWEWHHGAAERLLTILDAEEIEAIKHNQEAEIRFHLEDGMAIRNMLRENGYSDETYGNLDEHYQSILAILYRLNEEASE